MRVIVKSGFPLYFRLVFRTLFRARGTHARWTPKRVAVMSFFLPVFTLGQCIHRVALWLDPLLYPAFKEQEVTRPVFLLGIPRSGTTFLHRVMSGDDENFTTMKLWEMIFAPAIVEKKFWSVLGNIDSALGGYAHGMLVRVENRIFKSVRNIHHVSLFEPEEDDLILFPIFSSIFLLFPFPFEEELWHHARFDLDTPRADRERIMKFYKECIQRHLYFHGSGRRYLAKNPTFSGKIESLREHFPDADLVCNVRDPHESIPSLLSFLSFTWERFGNDFKGDAFRDMILRLAGNWYRMPMEYLSRWPEEQYEIVLYDELRGDPNKLIEGLYEKFDLEISAGFSAKLLEEEASARNYSSKHSYSLEKYGLSVERVESEYADVLTHYGFERRAGSFESIPETSKS